MPYSTRFFLILSASLIALIGCSIYLFGLTEMNPEVRFLPNSKFGQFILSNCDILKEPFRPTFWASSQLMQTVIPSIFRGRLPNLLYAREVLTCPDGGVVALDWLEGANASEEKENKPARPIALLFPGLVGDSQSDYLRNIAPVLKNQGYRVVSFNNRGRGGLELRSPRLYCASNIEDYDLAINHIRLKNPTTKIIASGFSMGAMLLTRYLAEKGEDSKIDAAMLVSGNYDLVNGTKNMETGWVRTYSAKVMTKHLAKIILDEKKTLSKADKPVEWDKLASATSFRQLDQYFTCPMWGYSSPDEYFIDATNNQRMPKIKVPTLCLNAADDMFSPYETLPLDKLSESTVFVVTKYGGHLGFADGLPSIPYYGDRLIAQYYRVLKEVESLKDLV